MKHITSKEMQQIDKRAQKEFGIPSIVLMENAGRKAFKIAHDMLPKKQAKVICVCGGGNNGGDGLVCARHLINNGIKVDIFLVGQPGRLKGDAKANFRVLRKTGATIKILKGKKSLNSFKTNLKKAQLLIDAIFGIGLSGEVKEPYKSIISLMNQSKKPILALDVPSGLDATTGKKLGACIRAKKTVTFALPKTGFIKNDGPRYSGRVVVADISIPRALLK